MGFFDKTIAASLKFVPKPLVRRVARQYIAGEQLQDAIDETRRLNAAGCLVTMDLLGESVTRLEEAEEAAATYLTMLDAIAEHDLDANVSIKPTGTGLTFGQDVFLANIRPVLDKARELANFVRIDMEDSGSTDATLAAWNQLRDEGYDNVGIVLQAMLLRTLDDLKAVEAREPSIRVCKGIYQEPPEVAWQDYDEVNDAFIRLLEHALPRRSYYLGIATHDDPVIEAAERLVAEYGLSRDQYEFQMLLGVRPEVRKALVDRGHRVRVYVPYGKAWYAYCVRRLKENPKFAGYVTRDVLKDPARLFGANEDGR